MQISNRFDCIFLPVADIYNMVSLAPSSFDDRRRIIWIGLIRQRPQDLANESPDSSICCIYNNLH